MSKKTILIMVIIIVVVAVGYVIFGKDLNCIVSGGKIVTENCCLNNPNFPNNCNIGACGCSPENSKPVRTCSCGAGSCWGGSACLPR